MLIFKLKILAVILLLYIIAGSIDFYFKERKWHGIRMKGGRWADMPGYLMHSSGWWIWITFIWALPMLYLALNANKIYFLGFIIFSLEDIIYFGWKKILYKEEMQNNLDYLLPPFLRNIGLTKKFFKRFFYIQAVSFILLLIFFPF